MSARLTIPQDLPVLTEEVSKPREGVHLPAPQKTALRDAASSGRTAFTGVLLAVGVISGVGLMEYANPSEIFRPSYFIGTLSGRKETAELNAAQDAQAAYVKAVKEGELGAQIAYETKLREVEEAYQRDLADIEADKQNVIAAFASELDRTNKAYEAMYQMTNNATQVALEMERDLARARAETVASAQGAKRTVAALADWVGIFGQIAGDSSMAGASNYADNLRSDMAAEISRGAGLDVGSLHRQIMQRIPNVAEIRLQQEANIRAEIEQRRAAQAASPAPTAPAAP